MSQGDNVHEKLWIRTPNSVGNEVDPRWVDAAHRIWERARFVVIRYLADDTEAAEIVEHVVDCATRSGNAYDSVHHVDSYLLRSVAREAIRRRRKGHRLTFVDPNDLERLAGAVVCDWDARLDERKCLELLRASLDAKGRQMLDYRVLEYDWTFIARALGYANGHSAEVQFRKKVARALARIRMNNTERPGDRAPAQP